MAIAEKSRSLRPQRTEWISPQKVKPSREDPLFMRLQTTKLMLSFAQELEAIGEKVIVYGLRADGNTIYQIWTGERDNPDNPYKTTALGIGVRIIRENSKRRVYIKHTEAKTQYGTTHWSKEEEVKKLSIEELRESLGKAGHTDRRFKQQIDDYDPQVSQRIY